MNTPNQHQSAPTIFSECPEKVSRNPQLERLIADGERRRLAQGTIENKRDIYSKWIRPQLGSLHVSKWTTTLSQQIIDSARETCGPDRVENIGTVLTSLRGIARQKDRDGIRWLAPTDDPMEGVSYTKGSAGATGYVEPNMRPSSEAVEALHNYWSEARRAADAWPVRIPMYNLRHFAAVSWWHETLERPWEDVATLLGDSLATVLKHYVLSDTRLLAELGTRLDEL